MGGFMDDESGKSTEYDDMIGTGRHESEID